MKTRIQKKKPPLLKQQEAGNDIPPRTEGRHYPPSYILDDDGTVRRVNPVKGVPDVICGNTVCVDRMNEYELEGIHSCSSLQRRGDLIRRAFQKAEADARWRARAVCNLVSDKTCRKVVIGLTYRKWECLQNDENPPVCLIRVWLQLIVICRK